MEELEFCKEFDRVLKDGNAPRGREMIIDAINRGWRSLADEMIQDYRNNLTEEII